MNIKYLYIFLIIICCSGAEPKQQIFKRSKPPQKWDDFTKSLFIENAFDSLKDTRPSDLTYNSTISSTTQNIKASNTKTNENDFDLSDMMVKLEALESNVSQSLQDKKTFLKSVDQLDQYAETMIIMARTLFNSDPSHYDDPDSFLKYSERMKENARSIKVFTKQKDFESTSQAFSKLKQNCTDCHTQFRL